MNISCSRSSDFHNESQVHDGSWWVKHGESICFEVRKVGYVCSLMWVTWEVLMWPKLFLRFPKFGNFSAFSTLYTVYRCLVDWAWSPPQVLNSLRFAQRCWLLSFVFTYLREPCSRSKGRLQGHGLKIFLVVVWLFWSVVGPPCISVNLFMASSGLHRNLRQGYGKLCCNSQHTTNCCSSFRSVWRVTWQQGMRIVTKNHIAGFYRDR